MIFTQIIDLLFCLQIFKLGSKLRWSWLGNPRTASNRTAWGGLAPLLRRCSSPCGRWGSQPRSGRPPACMCPNAPTWQSLQRVWKAGADRGRARFRCLFPICARRKKNPSPGIRLDTDQQPRLFPSSARTLPPSASQLYRDVRNARASPRAKPTQPRK